MRYRTLIALTGFLAIASALLDYLCATYGIGAIVFGHLWSFAVFTEPLLIPMVVLLLKRWHGWKLVATIGYSYLALYLIEVIFPVTGYTIYKMIGL